MSGGGSTTSTSTVQLSPEQKQLLGLVTPAFASYFPTGAGGKPTGGVNAQTYPGSTVAPQNPLETIGQQMTLGAAPAQAQSAASALSGNNWLTSGGVLDPTQNPGLQGAIAAAQRPITQNFAQTILPGIDAEAVNAGGYGGNRQGIAQGMASQAYMNQLGDTAASIINPAYQAGLDAMTKGQALAPSLGQYATAPGATVSGVGTTQRGFQQAQLTDTINRFYQQQFLPLMIAQQIAGTALGFPGGSTTTQSSGGSTSPVQTAAGGISALLGIIPFL